MCFMHIFANSPNGGPSSLLAPAESDQSCVLQTLWSSLTAINLSAGIRKGSRLLRWQSLKVFPTLEWFWTIQSGESLS